MQSNVKVMSFMQFSSTASSLQKNPFRWYPSTSANGVYGSHSLPGIINERNFVMHGMATALLSILWKIHVDHTMHSLWVINSLSYGINAFHLQRTKRTFHCNPFYSVQLLCPHCTHLLSVGE